MKKFITLLFLLVVIATTQAQTNVPLTNGDFSAGDSYLSGSSAWTSISGWTISENIGTGTGGNAALTAASSGVISGALTLVGTNSTTATLGTNNANQAALLVESDKIDISSYAGSTTAFTYAFQIKVATATGSNAPWNVIIKVYDASNTEIAALVAISATTKVQPSLKTTAAGTYVNASAAATLTGSGAPAYITVQVHLGQMLANTPTLDNFTLTAAGAAASTTLTQPANTALSYEIGNGPSAEQSFQVAGANLGSNNITVTPGANIEISSTSGSGFASSAITLTPTGGTVATTTLYARLIAGQNLGSVGANATRQVNVAATGTTTKTIQFTGTVTGIAISGSTGSTLSYMQGAGPSSEQSFSIQGVGLSADVVVTPGANMEISTTTGTGFASAPITLTQVSGAVAVTPIYARLKNGLPVNSFADATTEIIASTTGFANKSIQYTGTVDINTSFSNKNTSNLKCIVANNAINVVGVEAGKQIDIYNNVGQKVKSVIANENTNIALPTKGIYFVKVDTMVEKVILK